MPSPKRWYRRFFGLEDASPSDQQRARAAEPSNAHRLASAGIELAGGVLLFAGGGYLLDNWWGTTPWMLVVGAMLGLAGGMYRLIKAVQEANR